MKNFSLYNLEDVCEIQIGKTPRREVTDYWGEGFSWVAIADMKSKTITKTKEAITAKGAKESGSKLIPKGTILLSFKLSIGKVAFAGSDLFTNEAIAALKIRDTNRLTPNYLYYVLKNIPLVGSNNAAMGSTLNKQSLRVLKLPIPDSVDDQIYIADILSKAENLIAQRKESIRLLDEYLKSTFLDMFGDPVKNEKGWEKKPLEYLGTLDRGVSKHRPRNYPALLGGKYPLIQTGEVANSGLFIKEYSNTYSELGLSQSKLWPKGTLLITIAANIAKTGILSFDACFPDSIVGFKANDNVATVVFVHYLFGFFQKILEENAPQAAQKNINLAILRTLPVPLPPFDLQLRFSTIVAKVETLRDAYINSLSELENLYGSLSQQAFTAQLIKKVIK